MIEILIDAALRSLMIGGVVGLALQALKVRNPQVEMTAWITVLVAALAMPLLLCWPILFLSSAPVAVPETLPDFSPAALAQSWPDAGSALVPSATEAEIAEPVAGAGDIDVLPVLYLAIAGMLLARLAIGVVRTWRIVRRAVPIRGDWVCGRDLRLTDAVTSPVTFGRTVLLPVAFADWPPAKRRAVLSHECSHLDHHDFEIQLLGAIHAALFWFSPLAWWLQLRLAFLAERTSDEAAIARVGSRVDYAEILLDLAVGARGVPAGIAMARPAMLRQRVESLLARDVPAIGLAPLRRALLVLALLPGIVVIGGTAWHARAQTANPVADIAAQAVPDQAGRAADRAAAAEPAGKAEEKAASGAGYRYDFLVIQHDGHLTMLDGSINVDNDRVTVTGAGSSVNVLLNDRGGNRKNQVLFGRDGIFYRSTDSDLIDRITDLMRPEEELSKRQEELGRKQEELGRQQGELGRQQGDFGRQQGEVGRELGALARDQARAVVKHARALAASMARLGKSDDDKDGDEKEDDDAEPDSDAVQHREDLNRQARELGRQQSALGEQQRALGERQRALGNEQRKLGEQQKQLARDAEAKMHVMLDQAIANGTATQLL
jgi:beta-lactamase regulating signal transducer with metallopeptidase domain